MLKKIILFTLILVQVSGISQVCDFPLPPSNTCQTAPLLCSLDGFCSNNGAALNSGTPDAFCGQVENNNWVAFIAGSTAFELEVTVENCVNGQGLQAQFFGTNNCQTFTAVSNCLDPVSTIANVVASNLEVGTVYYLMMDGKGGDVCDYSYRLVEGIILSPAEAVIEGSRYFCKDQETLILDGSTSGSGTPVSYEWSTANGNILGDPTAATIEIDEPGIYSLLVRDEGGCEDVTEVEIAIAPIANVFIETPLVLDCVINQTVSLSGNETTGLPVTFNWTTTNGNIISGAATPNPEVDAPGIYTLVVTNTITECTEEASIEVISSVSTPVAIAGPDQELNCLNETITFNGAGSSTGNSFRYQWSSVEGRIISGENTIEAVVDLPGTYVLSVTNSNNGCVDTDEVFVAENLEEPTGLIFDLDNPCFGEEFGKISVEGVLGGTEPYLYSIDDGSFGAASEFRNLAPREYRVGVEDATGCTWDTILRLLPQPEITVSLGEDELLPLGCAIEVEARINFPAEQLDTLIWQDLASCPGCAVQVDSLIQDTRYTVRAIDQNGCEATAEKIVRIDKKRLVFIPNIFSPNDDGLNDKFMVFGGKGVRIVKSFRVFDRWGATLWEKMNFQPEDVDAAWDGRLNGEYLNTGVYVYFAEVEFVDGVVKLYKGSVALTR